MAVLPPDPIFCLRNNMEHVHNMCFDNETEYSENLYASTESGFVYVWDLNKNRLKHKQELGVSIQAIHIYQDNLITQEKQGTIKLWQKNEANLCFLRELSFYGGYCKSKLIKNELLLPQENGSSLELINIDNFESIRKFTVKDKLGNVMCLEMTNLNDQLYVLAGYETGDILLFDYNTGKLCSKIKLREFVTSLTFDPISRRGLSGNISNMLQLFTIETDLNITLKCEINIVNKGCSIVKIRPDRKIFVSGGLDARLRLYSWKSLRTLAVLAEHKKSITDVQFTPKCVKVHGEKLMTCSSADGGISLWNIYN